MLDISIAVLGAALLFLGERLTVGLATRGEAGRSWIRRHAFLHPNRISYARMPMGLVTVAIWEAGWQVPAFLWFAFWMITDLTDGTIARKCDLMTESGKWIDPLSDKLLYLPVLFYLAFRDSLLPLEWVIPLALIDMTGQASRLFVKKTAANSFGKSKTALITVVIILAGLELLQDLPFVDAGFLHLLTVCCTALAFLSFYCKLVPDNWYALTFAVANAVGGATAVYCVANGLLHKALVVIFLGRFPDLFDVRIAGRPETTSPRGVLDLAADCMSFGIAPSYLFLAALGETISAFVLSAALCCLVVVRRARLLQSGANSGISSLAGLPSPAAALLTVTGVLLFRSGPLVGGFSVFAYVGIVAAILGMVTPLRYGRMAVQVWPGVPHILRIAFVVTAVAIVGRGVTAQTAGVFGLIVVVPGFIAALLYAVLGQERTGKSIQ